MNNTRRLWSFIRCIAFGALYGPSVMTGISAPAQTTTNTDYALKNRPQVNLIPPSPEAAKLGEYGEVPVGYYTGSVNLSIPIAEIKSGSIKVPVSLDYSSGSGMRVSEIASNVGLGWTLNGPGVITRTVRNKPDDQTGFLYEVNNNYDISFFNTPQNQGYSSDAYKNKLTDFYRTANSCLDLQPDVFSFNFLGNTGEFSFGWDGKPVMKTNVPLDISYEIGSGYNGITKWTVKTSDGNIYIFDAVELSTIVTNTYLFSNICNPTPYVTYASSWYLSRVITPRHDTLNLTYDTYGYKFLNNSNQSISFFKDQHCLFSPGGNCACNFNPSASPQGWFTPLPNQGELLESAGPQKNNSVNGFNLKRISTVSNSYGDSLLFFYNTNRTDMSTTGINDVVDFKALDSIAVTHAGARIKSWKLDHDNATGRLTLNAVHAFGNTATEDNKYTMAYSEPIPTDHLSYAQDHWGYYNGRENNPSLVPTCFSLDTSVTNFDPNTNNVGFLTFYDGAYRDPDSLFAMNGLLTKITYPTGGSSQFTYEMNDCANVNGEDLNNLQLHPVNHRLLSGQAVAASNNQEQSWNETFDVNSSTYAIINSECFVVGNRLPSNINASNKPEINLLKINSDGTQSVYSVNFNFVYTDGSDTGLVITKKAVKLTPGTYKISVKASYYGSDTYRDYAKYNIKFDETLYSESLTNMKVGGARIRKITNYDPYSNATTEKSYTYNYPGTSKSSGCIQQLPGYYNGSVTNYQECHTGLGNGWTDPTGQEVNDDWKAIFGMTKNVYTSQSHCLNGITTGSHIGYSWVTETVKGQGKTEKHFTSPALYPHAVDLTYPFVPQSSISYKVGLLDTEKVYAFLNGNYNLVKSKSTGYQIRDTSLSTYAVFFYGDTTCYNFIEYTSSTQVENMLDAVYSIYQFKPFATVFGYAIPVSETETDYLSAGGTSGILNAVTTTKYLRYRSDYPNLLAADSTTNSDGKVYRTEYSYAMDETPSPVISAMIGHHMVGLPVTTRNYVSSALTATSKTDYGLFNGSDTIIAPQRIQASTLDNPLVTQLTYNRYDSKGHVLSYTERGGKTTLILWGYGNTYPVAEIQHVDESAFNSYLAANTGIQATLTAPASDNALHNAVQQLRTAFPEAMITGYAYQPLVGVTSQSDANNVKTYYEYDSMGRLSAIKDFNGNILKSFTYKYQSAQ